MAKNMQTENCPVEGFENIKIDFPDTWLVRHNETFWSAYREAGEISHNTGLLYGSIAVCETIEGLPEKPGEWPLEVFTWFIDTVYHNSLGQALNPKKKSSLPLPTTPQE